MKKICLKCGAEFEAPADYTQKTLCDACAAESIRSVVRERICVDCGVAFMGYPGSLRCEPCNAERKRERARIYRERQRAGKTRKNGSTALCIKCGKPYIVASGAQKYCPDCGPDAIRENDRLKSREWNRENQYYAVREEKRAESVAEIPCAVCGKLFKPHGKKMTCSDACAKALCAASSRSWEAAHREKRNAQHREYKAAKLAAMTDEERAEYRARVNAAYRENYKKRKEKALSGDGDAT